jgi:hypothetical protein
MARYLARPPIANDLTHLADGHLQLELKRPWRDGTTAFVLYPLHEGRLATIARDCKLAWWQARRHSHTPLQKARGSTSLTSDKPI